MSSEPQQFALSVLTAFAAAGRVTDQEVAAAEGPSTTTMTKLRKVAEGSVTMKEPRSDVLRRIDNAADWAPGSARALWRTGQVPTPRPQRSTLAEVTGREREMPARRRRPYVDPLDSYLEELEDRITELEERVDLLEAARRDPDLDTAEPQDYRTLMGDALEDSVPKAARRVTGPTPGQRARRQQDEETEH